MKQISEKLYNKYINQENENLKVIDVFYKQKIQGKWTCNIAKVKCKCLLCGKEITVSPGDFKKMKSCGCIKSIRGKEKIEKSKSKWLGKIFENNLGQKYKVIDYKNSKEVQIEYLETGSKTWITTGHINDGENKDPFTKSKLGYYVGQGPYKTVENGSDSLAYSRFKSMFSRCYDEKQLLREPTYRDCEVCEEWHNFQNFAKWFEENWYEYDYKLELDKDLLSNGSKLYSPETCVFLPKSINSALKNNDMNNLIILYSQHKNKLPKKIKALIKNYIQNKLNSNQTNPI